MKKLLAAAVFSILLVTAALADLAGRINDIISQPSHKNVQFSIHIVKADTGRTAYAHNANRAVVPASNVKIIVAAAALKYLGPDYEYKTQVGLCGDALTVIGSGDPLLGDKVTDTKYGRKPGWIFKNIAAALKQNGRAIIKDIIVDTTVFDDQRVHPNWPKNQLNRWYACEVSGLNFNGNCIDISAKNIGGEVAVVIEPHTSFVKVVNKVTPISKGNSVIGSYRRQGPDVPPYKIVVHGKCKHRTEPFAVAIERPAAFFGFLLAENLAGAGIKAQGQFIEKAVGRDCNFEPLAEYTTPIADCLARSNKNSFGLAAESLLKTIAAKTKPHGKNGSWDRGRKLIHEYLLQLGIEEKEFYIDDGSGLSKENKLSANALTRILSDVYKSNNWRLFKDSLAVGGVDGTIGKYFKEKKYKGRIFGKTGYIAGAKAFSGVCSTTKGDFIFSILANNTNSQTRKAINDIAKAILDSE